MKRWWLPTQKGIDLFPHTTVPPPRLVIRGTTPGSSQEREIAQRFNSQLKAFHGKCQQDYSLSPDQSVKRHAKWDGAKATYTNIQGQEIIELDVDQHVLEQLEPSGFIPWDWAIVNFKVPDYSRAEFSAFEVVPLFPSPQGTSIDTGNAGEGDKPMSFPDADNPDFTQLSPITVEGQFTAASICVDLTVVGPESAVVVNVYGDLPNSVAPQCGAQRNHFPVFYDIPFPSNPPSGDLTNTVITGPLIDDYPWSVRGEFWARLPDCDVVQTQVWLSSYTDNFGMGDEPAQLVCTKVIPSIVYGPTTLIFTAERIGSNLRITVENPDGLLAIYGTWDSDWTTYPDNHWWLLNIAGKTDGTWNTSNSYTASGGVAITYSDESAGSPADEHDYGYFTVTSPPGTNQTNYNYYFVPYTHATGDPGPDDVGDVSGQVIVAGLVGRGDPQWVFSRHTSDISTYNVWERRENYPDPIPAVIIRDDLVIRNDRAADTSITNHYGMPFLGQLIVDRKYGSIAFNKR